MENNNGILYSVVTIPKDIPVSRNKFISHILSKCGRTRSLPEHFEPFWITYYNRECQMMHNKEADGYSSVGYKGYRNFMKSEYGALFITY